MQVVIQSSMMNAIMQSVVGAKDWSPMLDLLAHAVEKFLAGDADTALALLGTAVGQAHDARVRVGDACGLSIDWENGCVFQVRWSAQERAWMLAVCTKAPSAEEQVQLALDFLEKLRGITGPPAVTATASWERSAPVWQFADGVEQVKGSVEYVEDRLLDILERINPDLVEIEPCE